MPWVTPELPWAAGSHTSRKAAETLAAKPKARATKMAHLMRLYRQAGKRGLTDAESSCALSEACECVVPVQSICSLRANLMEQGLVARGAEREGAYGKAVSSWFWIGGAK